MANKEFSDLSFSISRKICFCISEKGETVFYEVCLKNIGTVCFAQTTLATVITALFFKMAQCFVVVKM